MNALANPQVGEYLNQHFVATYQKVGTFRIVGGQKQGGNVASYFCTANGNVLDAVAGPVDAAALLREARWVVETRKMALLETHGDLARYKQFFRLAHAEQLPPVPGVDWSRLPPLTPSPEALAALLDQAPVARQLNNQGKVHLLLAVYPLVPLDQAYRVVYEKVLNETISSRPVNDGAACQPDPAPAWAAQARTFAPVLRTAPGVPFAPGGLDPESVREQEQARALRHALDDPPAGEVYAAGPLNVLLADLQRQLDQGATLRPVPLDAEVLARVNVTGLAGGPTPGLLRAGGVLNWPPAWHEPALEEVSAPRRAKLEAELAEALDRAKGGSPDPKLLQKMRGDLQVLSLLLSAKIRELPPDSFIQASRYLSEVSDAVKVLERPDAARYVDGTLTLDPARLRTVPELVAFMKEKRVKFAAAADGDESAYLALRGALADCAGAGSAPPTQTVNRGDL